MFDDVAGQGFDEAHGWRHRSDHEFDAIKRHAGREGL